MSNPQTITSAEMRALEQDAIQSGRVTGLELMERAGAGVVEAIFEEWPELEHALAVKDWAACCDDIWDDQSVWAKRAVVLCGPGNNGGDGFVVARRLRDLNWHVDVLFYGEPNRLGPEARRNYDRWMDGGNCLRLGFPDLNPTDKEALLDLTDGVKGTPLIIDALFGLGLNRPLTALKSILEKIEHFGFLRLGSTPLRAPRCVAIDIPSGMDSDTGMAPICDPVTSLYLLAVHAELTVTFHRKKPGHELNHAKFLCGKVIVKDIGL